MIWKPKKLTREQMAERRKEGVRLLEQEKQSQAEIARNLGVSEAAVSVWQKKLKNTEKKASRSEKQQVDPQV
jgi:predicted transcriptional regulator